MTNYKRQLAPTSPYPTEGKEMLINEIRRFKESYSVAGWDGYDAEPIKAKAVDTAIKFVYGIPNGVLMPEPTPENDGGVALDWSSDGVGKFSISIDDKYVVYAGYFFDGRKVRGNLRLESEKFDEIIEAILFKNFSPRLIDAGVPLLPSHVSPDGGQLQ